MRSLVHKNDSIFVANVTDTSNPGIAEIDEFPVGSSGNVSPANIIGGSKTGLHFGTNEIAVDKNGQIYVAEQYSNEILGFSANARGNVAPNLTLGGPTSGIVSPLGVALDAAGRIYVASCGGCDGGSPGPYSVSVFAAGSKGDPKPLRTIVGPKTQLNVPTGLIVGPNGDIYVADFASNNAIVVFGPDAHGDAIPKRVISGAKTMISLPQAVGLTQTGMYTESWTQDYLLKFALDANGDALPTAVIQGKKTKLNPFLEGIAAGPDGSVYVLDRGTFLGGGQPSPSILQFAATANGNVAPLSRIQGSRTRLDAASFIFVTGQSD